MTTSDDALHEAIDQLLADRGIEFLVQEDQRGFLYAGIPVCAGVVSDGPDCAIAIGAVVASHVEACDGRNRARFLGRLDRLRKDYPLARLEFTEPNRVVWSFCTIEPEDFSDEVFVGELEGLTERATLIAAEVCGRLGTGAPGIATSLVGLGRPAAPFSAPRPVSQQVFAMWLTHMLEVAPVDRNEEPEVDSISTVTDSE